MSTTPDKRLPDDYDPIAAGYIEREHSQIDPLFALLQEVRDNREEFTTDASYRDEWMARADATLDTIVLHTIRSDRRALEQSELDEQVEP